MQHGFTLVSVVFILVVLTALGAALAGISQRQHLSSAAEIEGARALQAARAGMEWASFQLLRNPPPPAAAPACPALTNFSPAGLGGLTVTVRCTRTAASDGSTALAFYDLEANACNAPSTSGSCPAVASVQSTYVERQLRWRVVR